MILDFTSLQIVQEEPVFAEPALVEEVVSEPGPAQLQQEERPVKEINTESQIGIHISVRFLFNSFFCLTNSILIPYITFW